MKLVLSHPTGNANVRAAASGLVRSNLLWRFYTAIACFPKSFLSSLSAIRPFSEIQRRKFDSALRPITKTSPLYEVGRLVTSKLGVGQLNAHETGLFCIDAVYKHLDKRVALSLNEARKRGATAVYAYEDGAVFSFREGKRLGLQCFYDLPTGYWRASRELLKRECERLPDWANTFTGFKDSEAKLERKDEELSLADHIFVASDFTASTLVSYPGKLPSVQVIPYGFPPIGHEKEYQLISGNSPLKVLYVGKLTQQKGIADLFIALDAIGKDVQLTIVGQKSNDDCRALNAELAKHHWIPSLPHQDIIKIMRAHDVLVFPSLFDGFGLVISEAMSQGTPVITTERTAGPSLICHGINGWLVKAGSPLELQKSIEHLLQSPWTIASCGIEAMKTAAARPWTVYSDELNKAILKQNALFRPTVC